MASTQSTKVVRLQQTLFDIAAMKAAPSDTEALHSLIQATSDQMKAMPPDECQHLIDISCKVLHSHFPLAIRLLAVLSRPGVLSYTQMKEFTADGGMIETVMNALVVTESPGDKSMLTEVVWSLYEQCPPARARLRTTISDMLIRSVNATPPSATGVSSGLHILLPIFRGFRTPLQSAHEGLLGVLSQLYQNEQMINDSVCAVSQYQAQLSECMRTLLRKLSPESHVAVTTKVFSLIISFWDRSNSKHCEAMLGCFADLLDEMDGEVFDQVKRELFRKLSDCMASDNAALASKSLGFFRHESFISLLHRDPVHSLQSLAPCLVKDATLHWEAEVNHRRLLAINAMSSFCSDGSDREDCDGSESQSLFHKVASRYVMSQGKISITEAKGVVAQYLQLLHEKETKAQKQQHEVTTLAQARNTEDLRTPFPRTVDNHLHLVFGREIGKGSYSSVKYSKRIETSIPQSLWKSYATKVVCKKFITATDFETQIRQEIALLREFDHPNISPLYASFEDRKNIYIVMEYCALGDLFSAVFERGNGNVSVEWARFCLGEIVSALEYVHSKGYYYGDVKSENILVAETGHLRLCDFGSCKSDAEIEAINCRWAAGQSFHKDISGTLEFLAPEVVTSKEVSRRSDVWAFGVLLVQVLCGFLPFVGTSEEEIVTAIVHHSPKLPQLPESTVSFISTLLSRELVARPTFTACQTHPFFENLDFSTLHKQTPPQLSTGLASCNGMADPRYCMQRRFSMVANREQQPAAAASETRLPIIEETDAQLSWSSTQLLPGQSNAISKGDAPPKKATTVAQVNSELSEFVTTMAPQSIHRPHPKRVGPRKGIRNQMTMT
ncbi:hypothetical protein DIPPA_55568 [Diplonema papillatum]|nr:hypothetical protein DIPPA_55568 [Diplonema papillatum]